MNDKKFKIRNKPEDYSAEGLMDEYMGFVYSIVYKKLCSSATAEDIEETVSDVFLKLFKSINGFDPQKSSLKTFIGVIARNTATDKYRQLKSQALSTVTEEDVAYKLTDDSTDLCDGLIERETQNAVFQALLSLKEPDRTIVFRRFYLDETLEAIAQKTGHSSNAVQKRLKRALKKLKKKLGESL